MMNKLLVILFSLLAVSLEAATITNWGAQLPTATPAGGDVILMQKSGVTYYFTPNQLAVNLSTNPTIAAVSATSSNGLYGVETTRNEAVSNAVVALISSGAGSNLLSTSVIAPFNASNSGLIGDGDSLMSDVNKIFWTLTNSFPAWRRFGASSNFAVSGSVLQGINDRWLTNVAPTIAAMKNNGLTNIFLIFDIGANDLILDSTAFLAGWSNYIVRAKSSNVTVITFTVLPQASEAINSLTNWFLANQYMRKSLLPDYLIDWARLLPNPLDTSWFSDGIHLTTNGSHRVAQAVDAALRAPSHAPVNADPQFYHGTNMFLFDLRGAIRASKVGNNFGIGTTAPAADLDVWGKIRTFTQWTGIPSEAYEGGLARSHNVFGVNNIVGQLGVFTTDAATVGFGGTINLGGATTAAGGTTSPYPFAAVQGVKEGAANTYNGALVFKTTQTDADIQERMRIDSTGNVGIGTTTNLLGKLHVVGGIVQTNGGIWQTWSLGAPSAPATQGAVYWNDGTNICAVFRNAGGALSTNKLSMTAWP